MTITDTTVTTNATTEADEVHISTIERRDAEAERSLQDWIRGQKGIDLRLYGDQGDALETEEGRLEAARDIWRNYFNHDSLRIYVDKLDREDAFGPIAKAIGVIYAEDIRGK